MRVDIEPKLTGNSAMMALLAKLGFEANPVTPELQDARRKLIALLKWRAGPVVEEWDGGIDWSKPIETVDGQPAVYAGPIVPGAPGYAHGGRHLVDFPSKVNGLDHGPARGLWYNDEGYHPWNRPGRENSVSWPQVRNKAEAIDWTKPIEFVDGTPAVVPSDNNNLPDRRRVEVEGSTDADRLNEKVLALPLMNNPYTSCYGGIWLCMDGSMDGRIGPSPPVVRNRVAKVIDWTKPIETVEGLPARLREGPLHKDGAPAWVVVITHGRKGTESARYYRADGKHYEGRFPDIRNKQASADAVMVTTGGAPVAWDEAQREAKALAEALNEYAKAKNEAKSIDWTKPIEGVNGEPAIYLGPILAGEAGHERGASRRVSFDIKRPKDEAGAWYYTEAGKHIFDIKPRLRNVGG